MRNLTGSVTLFASNFLVCVALLLLRHSASDPALRTVYLLAANGLAGLAGFLPFRKENSIRLDRPTLAIAVWSVCYCAEYGLFLVYPEAISISQLIVCNSLAPFFAVYLSRDVGRSKIETAGRVLSVAPIIFLLGISWLERQIHPSSNPHAALLLCCVFVSSISSQTCARYVARNRSPSWSQPRLTILNAIFLGVVIGLFSRTAIHVTPRFTGIGLIVLTCALIYTVQRFYVFGMKKADPFISAMTLCTIVPLSLGTEVIFEHRIVDPIEIVLAVGYVLATLVTVRLATCRSSAMDSQEKVQEA